MYKSICSVRINRMYKSIWGMQMIYLIFLEDIKTRWTTLAKTLGKLIKFYDLTTKLTGNRLYSVHSFTVRVGQQS